MRVSKKVLFCTFCLLFFFQASVKCETSLRRGLFVSMIQKPQVLSSRREISKLIDFAKKARIKILFVQIYRANQGWFSSNIADSTLYEDGLKNLSEDPFGLLIRKAHAEGIQVHAWMNMLSLSTNKDAKLLKKYGPSILTKNLSKKKKLEDYMIDDQFFLEPGDTRIQEDLAEIVEEILRAYPDLDGVQFDYIRYPDKNPAYGYTAINIERFKKACGIEIIQEHSQVWQDWKRAQVTGFLKMLVDRTRKIRPDIQISATGCMPYVRAYYEAFQDWPSWLNSGLVDFVTIMSYSPYPSEFQRWILTAKEKTVDFKKVNIAVGAYKLVNFPKTFEEEFRFSEKTGAGTCVIFHYGSLLENPGLSNFLISDQNEN